MQRDVFEQQALTYTRRIVDRRDESRTAALEECEKVIDEIVSAAADVRQPDRERTIPQAMALTLEVFATLKSHEDSTRNSPATEFGIALKRRAGITKA
jgi:hypothetical protein